MDDAEVRAVTAVNTIDPRRWIEDKREVRYLEANGRAVQRGAEIRRLFLIDSAVRRRDLLRVARAHEDAGVRQVRWLSNSRVSELTDMPEDAVLFERTGSRTMYVGHADPEDAVRVEFGERIANSAEIRRFGQFFELLFASANVKITPDSITARP